MNNFNIILSSDQLKLILSTLKQTKNDNVEDIIDMIEDTIEQNDFEIVYDFTS